MKARIWMRFLVPAALLLAGGFGHGQEDAARQRQDDRDPFAEPEGLRQRIEEQERLRRERAAERLPTLALRGYVEDEAGQALALLQIGEEPPRIVRGGDVFTWTSAAGSVELRIRDVGRGGVTVLVDEGKRSIFVR